MDKHKDERGITEAGPGADARPRRRASVAALPPELAPRPERAPGPVAEGAAAGPTPRKTRAKARDKARPDAPGKTARGKGARDKGARPVPHGARRGALALLGAVRAGATLDEAEGVLDALEPGERARARRLAGAVLRHRHRAAAVLEPLMQRRPRPETLDLLQLGVTEMLGMGEAPHGVVDSAVSIARAGGPKSAAAAGMVNAVLRRASGGADTWEAAGPGALPTWLHGPIAARWGEDTARAMAAAHEAVPPIDLSGKPGAELPGEALPTGSHRLPAGVQLTSLPGYDAGDWWVQDAAAALPVRLLDPQAGETVADLCAAPGGKTMQLAAAGAEVTAIDLSRARLRRVAENLARTGLKARLVAADALEWRPDAPLDAVLLDAPCSATGTIRRHPELPLIRDGAGLAALTALQSRLIDHALSLLKPGGRLVYAVCSLLPEEGEAQVEAALARHPGLRVEPVTVPSVSEAWTQGGAIRTRPDYWAEIGGMDGFFMVRLRLG